MRFLITGTAGFIGFHLARHLLMAGHSVTGIDAMTPYYDVALKQSRIGLLTRHAGFINVTARIEDAAALEAAASTGSPDVIIHLAAQAGVRYSLENPAAYIDTNLVGSWTILELARKLQPKHLLLASTSSIYGANAKIPFEEIDRADEPMTLYAATKKSMELMAHSYAHLWGIPTTVFRFFTVYGPFGRPDMALFKFVAAIERGEPIEIYGGGNMSRDFTYIDDLVASVHALIEIAPSEQNKVTQAGVHDTLSPVAPFRIVNLGGGQPVSLMEFVDTIEAALGRRATRILAPMQKGDVPATYASPALLKALTGSVPATPLSVGIAAFIQWYRVYAK